jgi:hypothetical protein
MGGVGGYVYKIGLALDVRRASCINFVLLSHATSLCPIVILIVSYSSQLQHGRCKNIPGRNDANATSRAPLNLQICSYTCAQHEYRPAEHTQHLLRLSILTMYNTVAITCIILSVRFECSNQQPADIAILPTNCVTSQRNFQIMANKILPFLYLVKSDTRTEHGPHLPIFKIFYCYVCSVHCILCTVLLCTVCV